MTDLATALADTSKLEPYQGRDVLRTSIAIRNAGDGLSEAMGIDPNTLDIGSTVYVVLECVVDAHDHKRIKDLDALELVQVLKAGTATLIDRDEVHEAVARQAEKIKRAKEDAAGVKRLPYTEELQDAHDAGQHTELVEGCPSCDAEIAAEAAERNGNGS